MVILFNIIKIVNIVIHSTLSKRLTWFTLSTDLHVLCDWLVKKQETKQLNQILPQFKLAQINTHSMSSPGILPWTRWTNIFSYWINWGDGSNLLQKICFVQTKFSNKVVTTYLWFPTCYFLCLASISMINSSAESHKL